MVKTKFRETRLTGLIGMIGFMLDRKFTEWMPIWVLVIEHPEGIFVIDTGENANVNDPGYFKSSGMFANWFDTTQFRFDVEREEEIDRQLKSLGIPVDKVKAVILTHLHLDHADGLRHFPNTPIIVSKAEWNKPFGDLPKLYPSWFKPELIELNDHHEAFEQAHYLTAAKDIVLVHTPGHTWHHCSVIVEASDCEIFFGADLCYTQQQLLDDKYSGTNASHKLAKQSYTRARGYCRGQQAIFIPSHEAAASERLKNKEFIQI